MYYMKMVFFALQCASRAGYNLAGAGMAGGELRRRRAMAYTRLYEETMDLLLAEIKANREAEPRSLEP